MIADTVCRGGAGRAIWQEPPHPTQASKPLSSSTTPTLRRTSKWISTLALFVLVAAFILSLHYHVTVRHPNTWRIEISAGAARVNWDVGPPTAATGPTQYDADTHSTPMEWWPRAYRRIGWPGFILPLWLPAFAAAIAAAVMWRWDLTPRAGQCPRCRYDCRGLPAGAPCPECGHAPRHAHRQANRASMP